MNDGYVDIVFDGPPSHESGRFVEVENSDGASVSLGEWVERGDGYWALRIWKDDIEHGAATHEWINGDTIVVTGATREEAMEHARAESGGNEVWYVGVRRKAGELAPPPLEGDER